MIKFKDGEMIILVEFLSGGYMYSKYFRILE